MDIIWMLALGGMNLLCVLTGARIARKTNRRAPRSAASHRNSRDAQGCAWPKPPLCISPKTGHQILVIFGEENA